MRETCTSDGRQRLERLVRHAVLGAAMRHVVAHAPTVRREPVRVPGRLSQQAHDEAFERHRGVIRTEPPEQQFDKRKS